MFVSQSFEFMATQMQLPATVMMDIAALRLNDNNPRTITDPKLMKLVRSLQEFPKMLLLRPIIVNDQMIIIGGNMRFRAAREAGMLQVPVIIASDLSEAEQYEFIIKDNVSGGDWDWDVIANDWSELPLDDWGLDLPVKVEENISDEKSEKAKAWKIEVIASTEAEQERIYNTLHEAGYDVKKK